MPFDFPNPPLTVGQVASGPGGIQWAWDGTKWTVPTGATTALTNTYTNVGRNLLHNGLFNIQQRGAGPWTTAVYTADRWQTSFVNDTDTLSLVALADSDRTQIGDEAAITTMQWACTGSATASSYSQFIQKIEGVRRLSGKTVTVSFWAKATSGTPRLGIGWLQLFGSGGSPSATVSGNYGVTSALSATWQRYNFTAAIPSAAGKTFGTTANTDYTQFEFWLSDQGTYAGRSGGIGVQTGTVQLWGIQLEIGTAATPLEKLDPRYDMSNCQRFYQTIGQFYVVAWLGDGNAYYATFTFPNMRAVPTLTSSLTPQGGTQPGGWPQATARSTDTLTVGYALTAAGIGGVAGTLTLSADL